MFFTYYTYYFMQHVLWNKKISGKEGGLAEVGCALKNPVHSFLSIWVSSKMSGMLFFLFYFFIALHLSHVFVSLW